MHAACSQLGGSANTGWQGGRAFVWDASPRGREPKNGGCGTPPSSRSWCGLSGSDRLLRALAAAETPPATSIPVGAASSPRCVHASPSCTAGAHPSGSTSSGSSSPSPMGASGHTSSTC
eukprot:1145957-Pelagomonas_calceolata.AAC.2